MTIKVYGYSVGDKSVGIGQTEFSFDTGLDELTDDEKEYIINGIIRDIWELHDNGNLYFEFSDEHCDDDWGYKRTFTYNDSKRILQERK